MLQKRQVPGAGLPGSPIVDERHHFRSLGSAYDADGMGLEGDYGVDSPMQTLTLASLDTGEDLCDDEAIALRRHEDDIDMEVSRRSSSSSTSSMPAIIDVARMLTEKWTAGRSEPSSRARQPDNDIHIHTPASLSQLARLPHTRTSLAPRTEQRARVGQQLAVVCFQFAPSASLPFVLAWPRCGIACFVRHGRGQQQAHTDEHPSTNAFATTLRRRPRPRSSAAEPEPGPQPKGISRRKADAQVYNGLPRGL